MTAVAVVAGGAAWNTATAAPPPSAVEQVMVAVYAPVVDEIWAYQSVADSPVFAAPRDPVPTLVTLPTFVPVNAEAENVRTPSENAPPTISASRLAVGLTDGLTLDVVVDA